MSKTPSPRPRVTLRHIADAAGLDPSTVSRAITGDERIHLSAGTRERVLKLARQMGYQANPVARGLRLRRTYTIGFVVPDITNELFGLLFRGAQSVAGASGYLMVLTNTDNDAAHFRREVEELNDWRVDGLLIATARRRDPVVADLWEQGRPLVLINRRCEDVPLERCVLPDDFAGAYLATTHLIELGHQRIAHIAGPPDLSTGSERRRGYVAALRDHHIGVEPELVVQGTVLEQAGYQAMTALLELPRPPSAVVAVNDLAAVGALMALRARGLRCPEDVALIGYNDTPAARLVSPPLSSMQLPFNEMGQAAAQILLSLIEGGDPPGVPAFRPQLVMRESTIGRLRPPQLDATGEPA